MAVIQQDPEKLYENVSGEAESYGFGFRIFSAADLVATVISGGLAVAKVQGVDYEVELVDGGLAGGFAAFLPGKKPGAGASVLLERHLAPAREEDLQGYPYGPNLAEIFDLDQDYQTTLVHDLLFRKSNDVAAMTVLIGAYEDRILRLEGAGPPRSGIKTISQDYAVQHGDRTIYVDDVANDVTVTLMKSADVLAADVAIMRLDGSAFAVRVVTREGDQLQDGDEYPLESKWSGGTFRRDGVVAWVIF